MEGIYVEVNNLYNFKNPIKHFINIDNIKFPHDISAFTLDNLCWTKPININIRKHDNMQRTLKMPNILNFKFSLFYYENMPNFRTIKNIDPVHKRLSANIHTGDFTSGEYDNQLEEDFEKLCVYDNLLKLDIKDFYGRIYTHYLDFYGHSDNFLTNLNNGATNGLILGNYISLYFAESYLSKISSDIHNMLSEKSIECEFSYFSDDFYFYCNKDDNDMIVKIFDKVLENHNFERSNSKEEIWTYESFNNYNMVARYWKKVIAHCNIRFKPDNDNNKMYFINQIIYRMSQLNDEKLKKTFINNFFKTEYFKTLDFEKHQIKDYDYHQLCFIFKFSPEVLLYAITKFSNMNGFEKNRIEKFFKVRFMESLKQPYQEEQLYYYFAISVLGFNTILSQATSEVLETHNQLLISYYIKDGLFNTNQINILKTLNDEKFWFQSYHLILYTLDMHLDLDKSIEDYLIPQNTKKTPVKPRYLTQKNTYLNFYKENINLGLPLIKEIPDVNVEINTYLDLKIAEARAAYVAKCEEDSDGELEDDDVDLEWDI